MRQIARAVLWDLDGTLIDSAEYHWQAWQETLAQAGCQLTRENFNAAFGQPSETAVRKYFAADLDEVAVARICTSKSARYRELIAANQIELLPGAAVWLNRLRAAGWRQALATSAPLIDVKLILSATKLSDFFDQIITSGDVERGKPDPAVFLIAAARLGIAPANCLVVEDAPAGITAAHRAGMRAIGVLTSHSSLSADLVVNRLDQLPEDSFDQLIKKE